MVSSSQPRTEFAAALNQICSERGIAPEVVIESIQDAVLAAYLKDHPDEVEDIDVREESSIKVQVDPSTGAIKLVKLDTDSGQEIDVTPPGFGRIAAQTAKQVILQRVREAEKSAIIDEYRGRIGHLITGMVLRFDGKNVIFDIGRGQGYMPPEEQIKGEFYKMNQRMSVLIEDIRETMRGETIIVSRSSKDMVVELFKREVPEVSSGAVEIKVIAREAGIRTKLAVASTQSGVDPVGSCVGQKGVRVQEVINELNNEKIDIIQHTEDQAAFISSALAPAEKLDIELNTDKKIATILVPDDQLSLAIGRGGQNVRLAAKLTGYKINIKGSEGKSLSVTGQEEFEIDQLGLDEDLRTTLAEANITTLIDLDRRRQDLTEILDLSSEQLDQVDQKVAAFQHVAARLQVPMQPDEPTENSEADSTGSAESPEVDDVKSEDQKAA